MAFNHRSILLIILIGLAVYSNSLLNGFVGDDHGQIVDNRLVHSLSSIPVLFTGSTFQLDSSAPNIGLYYKPLLPVVFSLIYSVSNGSAFPFHLLQLFLHIINCLLIYRFFTGHFAKTKSLALAFIFLLHPINNEAIVYISNFQDQLFAFFGLMALNLVTSRSPILIGCLFLLSLLSKETGIVFAPILMTYHWFFSRSPKKNFSRLVTALTVSFLVYLLLRIFVGNVGLQTKFLYMSENADLTERLLTVPLIIWYYLKMLFFPVNIAYGWYFVVKHPGLLNFWLPLAAQIIFLAGIIFPVFFKKIASEFRRLYIFFLLVFFLGLGLVMQVFPLDITVADRWFYLPLFGLLGLLGILWEFVPIKAVSSVLLIIVLALFALRDFTRNFDWQSNLRLCKHDAKINSQSYILESCLANELFKTQDYNSAEIHAQKAIDLYPRYFLSWYILGNIRFAQNDKTGAQTAFEQTLSLNNFGFGSKELALDLVYQKKAQNAKDVAIKYLQVMPNSAELWYALALANYQLGLDAESISASLQAYTLMPNSATYKVYYRLSNNLPITF